MFNFWSFFIKNKRFSQLLLASLALFGLISIITIPKESTPEVEVPIGIVSTILPGGSAEDMERLVTDELESGLTNLADVKKITSISGEEISNIIVEFDASADIENSIQKLKDSTDKSSVGLPKEAKEPNVFQVDFSNEPVMIIAVTTDRAPTETITLAKDVERELEKIPGISDVVAQGLRKREVQIIANIEALDRFGISISDVIGGISRANTKLPIGDISFSGVSYNVSFDADIRSALEVNDIVIAEKNGLPIYVRDIAEVSLGVERVSTLSRISIDGAPSEQAISFSVYKESGGDITKITNSVRDRIGEMTADGALEGSRVLVSYDVGEFVRDDLGNLTITAMQAIFLVMVILYLAIGLKEAMLAGISIPISFLIAFIGLSLSGNTINFVSLFSLILAVGILVDSAIVVIEGMHANFESNGKNGVSGTSVALDTLKEFHSPLLSGTMTTIAVFVPLFFISGITGEFIASIPFTMIFVLIASIIVALGFLPIMATAVMRKSNRHDRLDEKRTRYLGLIEERYKSILRSILGNRKKEHKIMRWSVIAFFAVLLLPMTGIVKVIFFPQEDVDFVFIEVETKDGTILPSTDIVVRKVEEILYEIESVKSFITTIGSGSSFSGSSFGTGAETNSNIANITVNLKKDRNGNSTEISGLIRQETTKIKDAEVRVLETNSGPPVGAPVLITFFGQDLGVLQEVATEGENILKQIEGARDIMSSAENGGIEFRISVDRDKASELGVSIPEVANILRTALHGTIATAIKEGGEDINLVVLLNLNPNYSDPYETQDTTLDSIRQINIPARNGTVLLGSFVDINIEKGSSAIRHEDSKRIMTVSSELEEGATATEIVNSFTRIAREEELVPEGITMKFGGETEEVNKSFREMGFAFIAGLLLMLAILVLEFDSLRYSVFVLVMVPLSLIGIFLGLAITRQPLSFPSLMGIIALAGILVNNAIILIDRMNALREKYPNKSIREVVVESGVSRLRPIMLTTLTTIIGISPLTYASGLWAPLAWSIIFGLSFSSVLTLVLIPILYDRWHK